jgi:hypothetical protein
LLVATRSPLNIIFACTIAPTMLQLLKPTWRFSLESICPTVIVTARGKGDAEFASYFFAPANSVPDDVIREYRA